jgi:hypothetical protein
MPAIATTSPRWSWMGDRLSEMVMAAVLAPVLGVEGGDALAAAHPLEQVLPVGLALGRHQHRDVAADDLVRRVAVQPLRARVPRHHGPVQLALTMASSVPSTRAAEADRSSRSRSSVSPSAAPVPSRGPARRRDPENGHDVRAPRASVARA